MTLPEMSGLLRALEQLPACRQRWFARATASQGEKTNPENFLNKGVCLKERGDENEKSQSGRDAADLLVWLSKSEEHKGKAAVCCVACDKQLHEKKNHQVMQ